MNPDRTTQPRKSVPAPVPTFTRRIHKAVFSPNTIRAASV
jgi:hypothetical protein